MWSEPVPKDSSPQIERRPASIKLPKNFQPKCRFNNFAHIFRGRDLTGRDLEVFETLLLGNKINGRAGWHTPSQALNTALLEVRNRLGPVCNDGNGVTGGDERALSVDHVAITITIGGSTKGNVVLLDSLD